MTAPREIHPGTMYMVTRRCAAAPVIARRPEVFFRKDGTMPKSIELELSVPEVFSAYSPQQFGTRLAAAVKAKAAELVAEREAQGKSFLGREAVLAQSPFDRPASDDEGGELDPKVACRDKWRRVEALKRVKAFLDAYRQAWTEFKRGVKDVVFPAGTYWMCRHAGCPASPL